MGLHMIWAVSSGAWFRLNFGRWIFLKSIKWPLLFFAVAAAACIMGVGISIAEKSVPGAVACIAALVLVMGFGFKTKKKMRENGLL
jgi:FtsH-binding integral membrane protein